MSVTEGFLERDGGERLAYVRCAGQGPGVMFLGGFHSDMTGLKAGWLQAWAQAHGRAFLRFDYSGHGASGGRFEDGCIGQWAGDAIAVLDALTDGPQILVGSSMGAWLAILTALARPQRAAALLTVAAAPDFTEDLMLPALTTEQRQVLQRDGRVLLPSSYADGPYPITAQLLDDGRRHLVLRAPLPLTQPARLLHGTADVDVPWSRSLQLLEALSGDDVRLTLIKGGDHRLSSPAQLAVLGQTLDELSACCDGYCD